MPRYIYIYIYIYIDIYRYIYTHEVITWGLRLLEAVAGRKGGVRLSGQHTVSFHRTGDLEELWKHLSLLICIIDIVLTMTVIAINDTVSFQDFMFIFAA